MTTTEFDAPTIPGDATIVAIDGPFGRKFQARWKVHGVDEHDSGVRRTPDLTRHEVFDVLFTFYVERGFMTPSNLGQVMSALCTNGPTSATGGGIRLALYLER